MNSDPLRSSVNLREAFKELCEILQGIAVIIAAPMLRVTLALPFFRSGLTRWNGFLSLSAGTVYLFENQFKLHVFGMAYGLPAPDTLAYLVAVAEIVLPILLVLGLATRLTAFALLMMTTVIQLVFPDGWANFHLYWASLAISIVALGPGYLAVDAFIEWYRRHPAEPRSALKANENSRILR